jgi:hypothetical protein
MRGIGFTVHISDGYVLWRWVRDRHIVTALEHRIVWESYHGPIPAGHIVHHINGIRHDNIIENLLCVSHSEHARLHCGM